MATVRLSSWIKRIPVQSAPVAIANMLAFGIQGLFALLLLGLFDPAQVAMYFVVSQIAFYWQNLAMAQSNTAILTNPYTDLRQATRQAMFKSIVRLLLLMPLAWIGLQLSELHTPDGQELGLMTWVFLIAVFQLAWYLAHAYLSRNGSAQQNIASRVAPPAIAAAIACIGAAMQWTGPTLLLSAMCGFAAGSLWIADAWNPNGKNRAQAPRPPSQVDNRATWLRMLHTLLEGLFLAGLAVVWQRSYGGEHAGWLLTLMRLLAFIPSLVLNAWQFPVLASPEQKQVRAAWVAAGSSTLVCMLSLLIFMLCEFDVFPAKWQGMATYCFPAAVWQAATCVSNTFSYLPYARGRSIFFTWLGIGHHSVCLVTLLLPTQLVWAGPQHFLLLSTVYAALSLVTSAAMIKAKAKLSN